MQGSKVFSLKTEGQVMKQYPDRLQWKILYYSGHLSVKYINVIDSEILLSNVDYVKCFFRLASRKLKTPNKSKCKVLVFVSPLTM